MFYQLKMDLTWLDQIRFYDRLCIVPFSGPVHVRHMSVVLIIMRAYTVNLITKTPFHPKATP